MFPRKVKWSNVNFMKSIKFSAETRKLGPGRGNSYNHICRPMFFPEYMFSSALLLPLVASQALEIKAIDALNNVLALYTTSNYTAPISAGVRRALYYQIGNKPTVLSMWHPFEEEGGGGSMIKGIMNAALRVINDTRDATGAPTISVLIKNAGWGGVANAPICTNVTECPDVIMLGTTQVAGRVFNKDFVSLNSFFNDYAAITGQIFPDNFLQKYYYDYFYNGEWMGIPVVTDTRYFYYNRTTLDALRIPYPPPNGNWGDDYTKTWTWKQMVEYAVQIKRAGYRSGFDFFGAWDEELKLVTMAARDYNAVLINSDGKCGFGGQSFSRLLDEVMRPLYSYQSDHAANPDFAPLDSPEVLSWIRNSTLGDPLVQPMMCCSREDNPNFDGFFTFVPDRYRDYWYDPVHSPGGVIGRAYMPGKSTFLGGSGASVTAKSTNKALAWRLLQKFLDQDIAESLNGNVLPPFATVIENSKVYSNSTFDMLKNVV
jgi:hypothetical protein